MRRLVVASAIRATLLTVPLSMAAAAPTPSTAVTDSARATAALEYLLAAQGSDGSIDGSLGETADFVIGAAAAGYDPATLTGCGGGAGALGFMAAKSDGAATDAAKTGKAILAVVAAGGDPTSFAGRDLLARLNALYHSDSGAFGDGATFSQSFAILATVASDGSVPATATAWLAALQDSDGSWSYGTAPVAAGQGDSNSTAIALMALDAAGVNSADTAGLAYLHTQQVPDGGFAYSTAWGSTSDPDSDALALQALLAAGQDPGAAAWLAGSNSVLTAIRSSQGADGVFIYPGWGESAFTTSQVPAALMRVPYGAAVHPTAGLRIPTDACPSPSPSSGATASYSASPSPSATAASSASPTRSPSATPTVRRTARPTVRPTSTPTDSPTAVPTDSPTAVPTGSATLEPAAVIAAETAGPRDGPGTPGNPAGPTGSPGGVPAPLVYGLAALAGLVVVVGGGWLLLTRTGTR
jgi:hypothetical protein